MYVVRLSRVRTLKLPATWRELHSFFCLPCIMYSTYFVVLIIIGSELTSGKKSENYNNVIVFHKDSYQASPMATYKQQWPR